MKPGNDGQALVFLGLGSNEGDRLVALRRAVGALAALPGVEVLSRSSVWETEHVGDGEQDPYLNACVAVRTALSPLALLDELKRLEALAGRQPGGHRRPRPIDLDILLYGDSVVDEGRLQVPHPELRRRAFVLEPLAEIGGDRLCPDSGETIAAACAKIRRKSGPWVRRFEGGDLAEHPGGGEQAAGRERAIGREQGGPGCCPGATSSLKA